MKDNVYLIRDYISTKQQFVITSRLIDHWAREMLQGSNKKFITNKAIMIKNITTDDNK